MPFLTELTWRRLVIAVLSSAGMLLLVSCASAPKQAGKARPASGESLTGGTLVETYRLSVTVAALNPALRKVTLMAADGSQNLFTAGPGDEMLEKLKIGEKLECTVTRVMVILLDKNNAALEEGPILPAVLTAEDVRNGILRSDGMQRTALVSSVDWKLRQGTIQLADGSTRAFPIHKEVTARQIKPGQEVVLRTSSLVAINLEKR